MKDIDDIAKYDIKKTDEMLQAPYGSSRFTTYDRVYSETNEACDKIISKFDVKDKSILTVLGSGDQAFQFYINGAKNKSWMLNRSNLRYIIDNGIITLG